MLLDVITCGSRGSQKDYDEMCKSLVPQKAKTMTQDTAKALKNRFGKKRK